MRKGMNPNRETEISRPLPPDVPVCAHIVHLPSLEGYHAERMEIVQASLMTARKHAGADAFWLIWDNGSCERAHEWLCDFGADMLIRADNIGKLNAMGAIFRMFPGSIVGISDDDILFYPDWLKIQLDTLRAHNAFSVSGVTTKYHMKYARPAESIDDNFPLEWDLDFCKSIGQNEQIGRSMNVSYPAYVVTSGENRAYLGGSHCQFLTHADLFAPYCKPTRRYMEPLAPIDRQIEADNRLRLLTSPRTARHIGNVMSEDDRIEIARMLR